MADMSMPKIPIWGWLAIAIAAFLLLKPKASVGQGPVTPMGSLSQVDMGTHQVSKSPGGQANVTAQFTGLTTDFKGAGITWRYLVQAIMGQPGNPAGSFSVNGPAQSAPFNVLMTTPVIVIPIPAGAPLGLYDVTAALLAEGSTPTGAPNGVFGFLPGATLTHVSAVNLVSATGAAVPAGSVGSVNVSQAMVRAAQGFLQ